VSGPIIGELFAGYGGLGAGVREVLGGEIAWVSEFDAAPSKILEHHFPGVPNFGDITLIDWSTVPPVDILTGGFPCQDVSLAGARKGLKDGTRSGLWSEFARAISALRPGLVVIENVRGLLSADADSGVESCTECVGDGPDAVSLRALGAVLGDLAELGYDAQWCGIRAADAGAPHGRFRVFIIAHPAGQPWSVGDGDDVSARRGTVERGPDAGGSFAADSEHVIGYGSGRARGGRTEPADGDVAAADAGRNDPERRGATRDMVGATRTSEVDGEEREWDGDAAEYRVDPSPAWGEYEPAIRRWEHVTGRVAPSPTKPDGKNGSHRLSADFVEWMQGLPAGHVTSPEIGLTRNEQLKALGNGVVPQQATLAIRHLLGRLT